MPDFSFLNDAMPDDRGASRPTRPTFDFLRDVIPTNPPTPTRRKTLSGSNARTLSVTAHEFAEPITSPQPLRTGFGRWVTVVFPLVDVDYRVDNGRISVVAVRMSSGGTTIVGSNLVLNIHDKSGEAFYVAPSSPPALLLEPLLKQRVLDDLSKPRGHLYRTMIQQWRCSYPEQLRLSLIAALNARMPAEYISQLIGKDCAFGDIAFTYASPQRGDEERVACVHGVRKDCIEATDRRDGNTKTFRLDRISNVRLA